MSVDSKTVRRVVTTVELTSSDPEKHMLKFAELRHSNEDPAFVRIFAIDGKLGKLNREQAAMLAGALSVFAQHGCFPDATLAPEDGGQT